MTRLLLTIFFVGLVVSAASFAVAGRFGVDWPPHDAGSSHNDHHDNGDVLPEPGPVGTRTIAWAGADELVVNFPAEVTYIQGPQSRILVTGPQNWIDLVRVEDGEISLSQAWRKSRRDSQDGAGLKVQVHGPAVRKFEMKGAQSLVIGSYDQDILEVAMEGAGKVDASGKTRSLSVELDGAGEGDFSKLATAEAEITINGAGSVTAAPTQRADLEINGIGKIDLTTSPPELHKRIHGIGSVNTAS